MKFECNPQKSQTNLKKHGISLEDAQMLWGVPNIQISAKTVDEERFMIIGRINGKCYSCIYTERGEAIRLISARRSRKQEEKLYYENI